MNQPQSELFPWEEPDVEPAGTKAATTPDEDDAAAANAQEADTSESAEATAEGDEGGRDAHSERSTIEASLPAAAEPDLESEANGAGDSADEDTPAPEEDDPTAGLEEVLDRVPGRERLIAPKEYYSISEVCDLVGLKPHVLRYWETQFQVLNPSKNRSGNRVYQRKEIRLVLLVKHLLYEEKYTVEGAKQRIEQMRKGGELKEAAGSAMSQESLALLREDLRKLLRILTPAGTA